MTWDLQALITALRSRGLKITPQRRAILELLMGDTTHPSAESVYQRVLAQMPDLSRTTVYNTLRTLVDIGALTAVNSCAEGVTRYDTNTEAHHHLICMHCHSLIDIRRSFKGIGLPARERQGFEVVTHQVTFYGYCPSCQTRRLTRPDPEAIPRATRGSAQIAHPEPVPQQKGR